MKSKTVFICKQCGNETPRWQGQCPACGAWNSIIEFEDKKTPAAKAACRPEKAQRGDRGAGDPLFHWYARA